MRPKSRYILAVLTASLLVTSGLFVVASAPTAAGQDEDPIKIAFLRPSPGDGLWMYGIWAIQGFQVGMKYVSDSGDLDGPWTVDGHEIQVKEYETGGAGAAATQAAEKARTAITEWGADILVGCCHSDRATSVVGVADTYGVPYWLCPAASASLTQSPKFNKYIFRVGRNSWHDALASAWYYGKMENIERVAFLGADYTFGRVGVSTAKTAFRNEGCMVVAEEYADLGTTDFSSQLQAISNANPDLVYVVWAGTFATMYNQMKEYDLYTKLVGSVIDLFTLNMNNFGIPGMKGIIENQVGFCYFAYDVMPKNDPYTYMLDTYKEENIKPDAWLSGTGYIGDKTEALAQAEVPELWAGQAFGTAQFIVEGLKEQNFQVEGNVAGEDGLIATWEGMELTTPLGETLIRPQDHQAVRPMYIARAVVDTREDSETSGLIIGERVDTVPRSYVDPPIKTDYTPYTMPIDTTISHEITGQTENTTTVQFSVSATGGQEPYTIVVDFGDGQSETVPSVDEDTTETVTHTYATSGTPGITVTDNTGLSTQETLSPITAGTGAAEEEGGGVPVTVVAAIVIIVIIIAAVAVWRK